MKQQKLEIIVRQKDTGEVLHRQTFTALTTDLYQKKLKQRMLERFGGAEQVEVQVQEVLPLNESA